MNFEISGSLMSPVKGVLQNAHSLVVSPTFAFGGEILGHHLQAKGVLIYVYRVTVDAAFELLIWRSQSSNVKVRALAEQVIAGIQSFNYDEGALRSRETFDPVFLPRTTASKRELPSKGL